MEVSLEVQTADAAALVTAVAGADGLPGVETTIDDGLVLRYCCTEKTRAFETTEFVVFALTVPVGISTSMIADAIGRYLRRKRQDGRIERARVDFTEEVESTDRNGNPIKRRTTRSAEIAIDRRAS